MRLLKKYFNRENKFSLKERFNMVMTVVTCFFMGVMSENGRGMQGIKGLIDGIGGLAVRMNGWLSVVTGWELGEQLMPLGMLVTLDSIFNRVIQNWKKGKTTWIFADEFYLLVRYEYSADFFYRLYKRIRKYSGFVTGLTQNVEELLKSDTARLMLANSEFLILLNQATTDRDELAALLNISDNQLSYITNVGAGHGLIRCSGNLVPFENSFPRNTKLYRLMTTKPGEG